MRVKPVAVLNDVRQRTDPCPPLASVLSYYQMVIDREHRTPMGTDAHRLCFTKRWYVNFYSFFRGYNGNT